MLAGLPWPAAAAGVAATRTEFSALGSEMEEPATDRTGPPEPAPGRRTRIARSRRAAAAAAMSIMGWVWPAKTRAGPAMRYFSLAAAVVAAAGITEALAGRQAMKELSGSIKASSRSLVVAGAEQVAAKASPAPPVEMVW